MASKPDSSAKFSFVTIEPEEELVIFAGAQAPEKTGEAPCAAEAFAFQTASEAAEVIPVQESEAAHATVQASCTKAPNNKLHDDARGSGQGGARDDARGGVRDDAQGGAQGGARDDAQGGAQGGARDGARGGGQGDAQYRETTLDDLEKIPMSKLQRSVLIGLALIVVVFVAYLLLFS